MLSSSMLVIMLSSYKGGLLSYLYGPLFVFPFPLASQAPACGPYEYATRSLFRPALYLPVPLSLLFSFLLLRWFGAGSGNRTHLFSLEG